jgi:hypothetical protein
MAGGRPTPTLHQRRRTLYRTVCVGGDGRLGICGSGGGAEAASSTGGVSAAGEAVGAAPWARSALRRAPGALAFPVLSFSLAAEDHRAKAITNTATPPRNSNAFLFGAALRRIAAPARRGRAHYCDGFGGVCV